MDKNYNVDDILSEIKRKKSQNKGAAPPPRADFPQTGADRKRDFIVTIPDDDTPPAPDPEEIRTYSPRRERPVRPAAPPPAPEEGTSNPLAFDGHVRPITDKARMRQGRPLPQRQQPQQRPVRAEFQFNPDNTEEDGHHTRVMPKFSTGRELRLEDIQRMDFGPENTYDDLYLEDDYDDGIPEGTQVDFSEYNSVDNRDDVATDIAKTKLWLFIRCGVTLLLTFFAFYFAYSGPVAWLPMPELIWDGSNVRNLMVGSTILTALVAIVNSAAVGGGLISFFKLRANADSLASFAVLAAVAQGIVGIVNPEAADPAAVNFYFPIACLAMLFNALGKLALINRTQLNFRVLGSDMEKKAVLPVENPEFCHEFAGDASARKPVIAYSVKAGFFTDYLALSYSDKYDVGINRSVAPVCVVGALVVSVATFLLTRSAASAVSAFTAILCVSATLSATFIENIPLLKMAKKITPQGGMVSGSKAVEDFCDTKAVVMTETDLFGRGSVSLQGIKAFSQGRIDEAILDAASVLCALDGSLAPLFLKMINNNRKLLKKVDNIVFENDMGVSAWIDSRRVLIGNRKLMLGHGISLPADSYERGEAPDARGEPIYLSNSGEVSARFLVDYAPNPELAAELDLLAAKDIRLLVSTSDANISARKVWEAYGYPEDLITILPSDRLAEFRKMSAPRKAAIAEIVYTGRAPAMVRSILACVAARSSILSATIIELAQMILGYGLVAFLAFMGAIGTLDITKLALYQIFWFVAIFIVQQVRQS